MIDENLKQAIERELASGFRVELLGETARYPRPQEAALLLLFLLLMLTPLLLRTLPGLFSASIAW